MNFKSKAAELATKYVVKQLELQNNNTGLDKELLDTINQIYLPDLLRIYNSSLYLKQDGRNFGGGNNEDNKGFFYDKENNILINNGSHYISDKMTGYNPFYFVREHFCNGDNHATYEWFKREYSSELAPYIKKENSTKTTIKKAEKEILKVIPFGEVTKDYIEYRRSINVDNIVKYGIPVLDDYLGGILDSELVVVGAETGVGKSEFAYISAAYNALKGKKVLLLALEGDISEISSRLLLQGINTSLPEDKKVSVPEYRFNMNVSVNPTEDKVFEEMEQALKENLFIFDKKSIPSIEAITNTIKDTGDKYDLIIIDHLHYIYLGNYDNENNAIGLIMRELKQLTDIKHIPILLMSHLRKKQQNEKIKEPDISDLYGSSNIGKEATTVLLLMKEDLNKHSFGVELENREFYQQGSAALTKIKLCKSRAGLSVPSRFSLIYNLKDKRYEPDFQKVDENSDIDKSYSISNIKKTIHSDNFKWVE